MVGEKPSKQIVKDVIVNTAESAVRSGIICGASSLAKTKIGKGLVGASVGVLVDSAKYFVDFCNGKIGAEDLMNSVSKIAVSTGINYAKAKVINSFVSAVSAIGIKSLAGFVGSTSKIASSVCGLMKGCCGAFLALALVALVFSNDANAKIDFPNDPRVTTLVEVNEKGYCTIKSSMDDNLIDKLVRYNEKLSVIEQKTNELNRRQAALSLYEKTQIENIINSLNEEVALLENQILRQAERKALEGSENYHKSLRASVESYVEGQMTIIKNQNIKLNELKGMEIYLRDEKRCCDKISESCQHIIHLGKGGTIQNKEIKDIISQIADDLSVNPILYKSNNYTTGADILAGCLMAV